MFHRLLCASLCWLSCSALVAADQLQLKDGDSICLIGNALGERLQHHPDWEDQPTSELLELLRAPEDRTRYRLSRRTGRTSEPRKLAQVKPGLRN